MKQTKQISELRAELARLQAEGYTVHGTELMRVARELGDAERAAASPRTSHTPGPWTVTTELQMSHVKIGREKFEVLSESDARLIAAAPEMLEALTLVLANDRIMNALDQKTAALVLMSVTHATGSTHERDYEVERMEKRAHEAVRSKGGTRE